MFLGEGLLSSSCARSGTDNVTRLAKWLAARPNEGPLRVTYSDRSLLGACTRVLTQFTWDDETEDPPGPHIVIVGIPDVDE